MPKPDTIFRGKTYEQQYQNRITKNLKKRAANMAKRFNITMQERVMAMVDAAASQSGENRSAYLAKAAMMRVEKTLHH
ncbi:MAG: type II toxin-antitoxin system HicB family antitoxin [Mariprofundaceae bacterium]